MTAKEWPINIKLRKDFKVLEDKALRHAGMALWQGRLELIKQRSGLCIKSFCTNHGFEVTLVFHQMAGKRSARKPYYDRFERALAREEAKIVKAVNKVVDHFAKK